MVKVATQIVLHGLFLCLLLSNSHADIFYPQKISTIENNLIVADSGVASFDLTKQSLQWSTLDGVNAFEPTVTEQQVLVGSTAGLYALNRQNGSLLWHVQPDSTVFSPTVSLQKAYVASEKGELFAVGLSDGSTHWKQQFSGWVYPPALAGNYLVTGGQAGKVWGLSSQNGDIIWQIDVGQELVYRPVLLNSSQVIISTFDADIILLDVKTGQQIWKTNNTVVSGDPLVDGNHIYIADMEGTVTALNAQTGAIEWRSVSSIRPPLPLHVSGHSLFVSNEAGSYAVLNINTGKLITAGEIPGCCLYSSLIIGGNIFAIFRKNRGTDWKLSALSHR